MLLRNGTAPAAREVLDGAVEAFVFCRELGLELGLDDADMAYLQSISAEVESEVRRKMAEWIDLAIATAIKKEG